MLSGDWATTIRQRFLTVRAGVDYTNKFKTSLERGLSDALKIGKAQKPRFAAADDDVRFAIATNNGSLCGRALIGGLFCQNAHFNHAGGAAQRRTASARA
jgi:hypothetical protein